MRSSFRIDPCVTQALARTDTISFPPLTLRLELDIPYNVDTFDGVAVLVLTVNRCAHSLKHRAEGGLGQ